MSYFFPVRNILYLSLEKNKWMKNKNIDQKLIAQEYQLLNSYLSHIIKLHIYPMHI